MKLQKKRPMVFSTPIAVSDVALQERSKVGMAGYASGAFSMFNNGLRKATSIFHRKEHNDVKVPANIHPAAPKLPPLDLGPKSLSVVVYSDHDVTRPSVKPVFTMPVMLPAADKLACFSPSKLLVSDTADPITSVTPLFPEVVISSPLAVSSSSSTSTLAAFHHRNSSRTDSAFSESTPLFGALETSASNDETPIILSKNKLHRALRKLKSRFSFRSQRSNVSSASYNDAANVFEVETTSRHDDESQGRNTRQDAIIVQSQDASLVENEVKVAPIVEDTLATQSKADSGDVSVVEDMHDVQDESDDVGQPRATAVPDMANALVVEGLFELEYAPEIKLATDHANVTNIEDEYNNADPSNAGSETSEEAASSSDDNRDDNDDDDDNDDNEDDVGSGDNDEGESDVKHGENNESNVQCHENNVMPADSGVNTEQEEDEDDDEDDVEEEVESTNKDGRSDWVKMNAIPLEVFTTLLEWKLPADRKMLSACVSGTTRGAYHYVVFINCLSRNYEFEQFVVKVPAHGVPGKWREEDGYMLCQEAETMKYLYEFTTIPVPEVIAYSPDANSRWGFPYIIMSRLQGRSATHIWCDDDFDFGRPNRMHDIPSPQTEKKRINFLRSLAREMSKLKDVRFKGIGMPCLGDLESDLESTYDALPVDSTFIWTSASDPESVEERSAYYSTQDYTGASLEEWESVTDGHHAKSIKAVAAGSEPDDYLCQYYGVCKMLGIVFSHPVFQSTGEDFFLQHDDLDLQNVLTDDEGNVTGIIVWDGSLAMPRCVAHAAVPNFLRRDWFPDQEGTAAHLYFRMEHYRQVYAAAMVEAGNPDALYTTKSGLYQAALAAIYSGTGGNKYDLIEKLLASMPHMTKDAVDFTTALGNPSLCWQIEDTVETEFYKILDPELPQLDLQELVWDVAARAFMADFEAFFTPPTFDELSEAWLASFAQYFELEQYELGFQSSDRENDRLEDELESELGYELEDELEDESEAE